jgi:hypothetical protein
VMIVIFLTKLIVAVHGLTLITPYLVCLRLTVPTISTSPFTYFATFRHEIFSIIRNLQFNFFWNEKPRVFDFNWLLRWKGYRFIMRSWDINPSFHSSEGATRLCFNLFSGAARFYVTNISTCR